MHSNLTVMCWWVKQWMVAEETVELVIRSGCRSGHHGHRGGYGRCRDYQWYWLGLGLHGQGRGNANDLMTDDGGSHCENGRLWYKHIGS